MNFAIYISGVLSAILFTGWITTMILGFQMHFLFLIAGLATFLLLFLPMVFLKRREHRKRMDQIIRNYRHRGNGDERSAGKSSGHTGWSMNNSPFRERKSGLSWGGGNIHASEARRGKRRSFLK